MLEDLIEQGEYREALKYLDDTSDENNRYLRLICLIGLGEYQQAVIEGEKAKNSATNTYYDVLSLYLTALKETQEYELAINILIEELSMPYIPYNYESLFQNVYDEILIEKQNLNEQYEVKNKIFKIEDIDILLNRDNINTELLFMALETLQELNIRRILPTIHKYLSNPDKPAFAKSLIMEILIEQQIDDEFIVKKFDKTYEFNPSYQPLILEQYSYLGIGNILKNHLEDDNPSLLNQCIDYLEYYLYASYPQYIDEEDYSVIAGTIHYHLATMTNIPIDIEDIEYAYQITENDIISTLLALQTIE